MAAHSDYSFSGSGRWIKGRCPASVRMQRNKPKTTNDAAELGTAAHAFAEFCLMWGIEPREGISLEFNGYIVDKQMVDAVSVYVGYIRAHHPDAMLEKRVRLKLNGRDDVYGTGDMIDLANRVLHIADYKHGYGLVEVENNTQLICYAVAALDTFNAWFKVDKVVTTIIQPRANHVDGVIRSHEYTIDELLEWRGKIVSSIHMADDPNVKPVAGPWCKYCLASATCKARLIRTIDLTYYDEPVTDDQLFKLYSELPAVKSHLDAVADQVKLLVKSGKPIEGYKLVRQRKRAKIEDEKAFLTDCVNAGINTDDLYEKKLKPKSKLTKVVSSDVIDKHFVTGEAGLDLVPMSDNRIAVSMNKSATNLFDGVN